MSIAVENRPPLPSFRGSFEPRSGSDYGSHTARRPLVMLNVALVQKGAELR